MAELREQVRTYRKSVGLSQNELAVLLGLSMPTIQRFEQGKKLMPANKILLRQFVEHMTTYADLYEGVSDFDELFAKYRLYTGTPVRMAFGKRP